MKTKIFAMGALTALLAVNVNAFADDAQQGTTDQSQQMMQPQAPGNVALGSQQGTLQPQNGQSQQAGQGSGASSNPQPTSTGNSTGTQNP